MTPRPPARVLVLLLAAASLLEAGCGAGFRLRGSVERRESGPGFATVVEDHHRLPLAGARATLECPEPGESRVAPTGVTAEARLDGRFRARGPGPVPMVCQVRIEAAGYRSDVFPLSEVCTAPRDDEANCAAAAVRADLSPVH